MQTSENIDQKNHSSFFSDSLIMMIFALIISYITYLLVITLSGQELSDYNGHIYTYITTFIGEDPLKSYMMSPYFMWHIIVLFFHRILFIPLERSAALCTMIFTLASYFLTVFMIKRFCEYKKIRVQVALICFSSFILTMLQPIWISFLDAGISRGVGSFTINPIYNPTYTAARPFALICFMLITDWWALSEGSASKKTMFFSLSKAKTGILLSVMLFLSAFAKPVFSMMFIPAVGIIMLARFMHILVKKQNASDYFKKSLLKAFLIALPCILSLLYQVLIYYFLGGSYEAIDGIIITKWLEVWAAFSENVPLSILFSMSFPIFILVVDFRNYIKEEFGSLGIVCFVVGFLQCALIGEGGEKFYHGNFFWQMMFGMLILWAGCLLHFFDMGKKAATRGERMMITAGWILLLIHLHYGFLYVAEVMDWSFLFV